MPTPVPSADWHAKSTGAYARESNEAFENAICTYNLLSSLGWTLSAICGVYGNIEAESGYNPWRWQNDDVLSSRDTSIIATSTAHGYGFPQFTPAGKYIYSPYAETNDGYGPNYSNSEGNVFDGDSQLRFIDEHADYAPTGSYPETFSEYKASTDSPEHCARAWLLNYERPYNQSESVQAYRASIARYWYDILIEYDPSEPIPPEPTPVLSGESGYSNKFKINFYLKPFYKKL